MAVMGRLAMRRHRSPPRRLQGIRTLYITYPIHIGDGRYTYRAGVAPRHAWLH